MREENLRLSIDGLCAGCKTTQRIAFREHWHLNNLYKIGTCPSCDYEHEILIERTLIPQ